MKVLLLGKFYPVVGGVEKVMYDLMQGLSARGIDCDMLCCNAEAGVPARVLRLNAHARILCVKAISKKFSTMISFQMVSRLRRIASDYDIIHVHHPDPMAALALLLSGYRGKVVLHWHSDILSQRLLLPLYLPLQRWLIARADTVVGTTPVYLQGSAHLRHALGKCVSLPIGISGMEWDDAGAARIRARYPGRTIIFSLGRLVHYKGFEYLVEAATHLSDDYMILIGGSGELKTQLEQQIAARGVGSRVKLLGRVADADLPAYFRACHLFCLSSIQKTEAFAIVQVEAMSCGRPVVATRIPESGVAWVNAHGVSGLNVPIKDGRALADAFVSILEDEGRYAQLSKGARQRFEEVFQLDEMIEKCLGIYRSVL